MEQPIQLFQIAELIFSCSPNEMSLTSKEELVAIKEKFEQLLKMFEPTSTHYTTDGIKKGASKLPYNTIASIGRIGEYTILHFATSYSEPLLFVVDIHAEVARNYIDINVAKNILNKIVYENIELKFSQPKNLDRVVKNIPNISDFIEDYKSELKKHNNSEFPTGRECFEMSL